MVQNKKKQLALVIWIVIILFVGFFAVYFYLNSLKNFSYAGVDWKVIDGPAPYYTNFHVFYNADAYYNLWLENNPKKNNIKVNASFKILPSVILSMDNESVNCSYMNLALAKMTSFLINAGNVEVTSAVADKELAKQYNVSFANCYSANGRTVFLFEKSDTPEIVQDKYVPGCYRVRVGNCENIETTERLIVAIIAQRNKVAL